MARTILYLPDQAKIVELMDLASTPKSAATMILDWIRNANPHIDCTTEPAAERAHTEVPVPEGLAYRPTPDHPTYGQLNSALIPFAEWGRNWRIQNARVYRETPGRKEQILSLEVSGPNLKAFVDATELIHGSHPESPPDAR